MSCSLRGISLSRCHFCTLRLTFLATIAISVTVLTVLCAFQIRAGHTAGGLGGKTSKSVRGYGARRA